MLGTIDVYYYFSGFPLLAYIKAIFSLSPSFHGCFQVAIYKFIVTSLKVICLFSLAILRIFSISFLLPSFIVIFLGMNFYLFEYHGNSDYCLSPGQKLLVIISPNLFCFSSSRALTICQSFSFSPLCFLISLVFSIPLSFFCCLLGGMF